MFSRRSIERPAGAVVDGQETGGLCLPFGVGEETGWPTASLQAASAPRSGWSWRETAEA